MRLFVSIDPPRQVRLHLSRWLPEMKEMKKTPSEQLHLTLLFLGDQPDDVVPDILEHLNAIPFDPFEITVNGIGAFPNTRLPSVIWAGTNEQPELLKLQNGVSGKLAGYSLKDSVKPFHPHITLARVIDRKGLKGKKIFSLKTEPLQFRADGFSLKKSVLNKEGAVHEVIKSFS